MAKANTTRTCPTCGTSMQGTPSRAIYCSDDCKICSVENCPGKVVAKRLCSTHYLRKSKGIPLILPCLDCGKDIVGIKGNPKRCGDCTTCNADGCKREQKSGGYCVGHYERGFRTGDPHRPCRTCGEDLPFGINPNAVHCSEECNVCSVGGCGRKHAAHGYCKLHAERHRSLGAAERPCKTCGGDMAGTVGAGLYCSPACRVCTAEGCDKEVSYHGLCNMHAKRMEVHGFLFKPCGSCGGPLPNDYGSAIYCSDECKPNCVEEGCPNVSLYSSGHCARHYSLARVYGGVIPQLDFQCEVCGVLVEREDVRYANRSRKMCDNCRGRKHREYAWYRQEVLAAGSADCGFCGEAIDLDAKYPAALSLTVDHITPLSLGGGNERENLRPAHSLCNSRRGNRIDVSIQMAMQLP